jgi:hypothetical protein
MENIQGVCQLNSTRRYEHLNMCYTDQTINREAEIP